MSVVVRNGIAHIICDNCGDTIVTVSEIIGECDPEDKDYCLDCELISEGKS